MSSDDLTLDEVRQECSLEECESCSENSIKIDLDRIPNRVIFRPEELDNHPRADCAIFFPEDIEHANSMFSNTESNSSHDVDYISIVELKSTLRSESQVRDQIEGALDFAIDLLRRCGDRPWNLSCYCLVPHNRGYTKNAQFRIVKNIGGEMHYFWTVPVNNQESLRDIVERDGFKMETL